MTANWTRLNPKSAPQPITPYFSQGAKAPLGQIVFVSGQVALDANGKLVGKDDVRELLDRLAALIAQAHVLLVEARPDNPVGRKFDFLCQEFNREANTLCSKADDLALTNLGIELKASIEQLREQAQNIE